MDDIFFHERMRREILDWIDSASESWKKMIDHHKITQEFFTMSENYWLTTMKMISNFQDQNEKIWNILMQDGIVAHQNGNGMFHEWMGQARKAYDEFTSTMEENWQKVGTLFAATPKHTKGSTYKKGK